IVDSDDPRRQGRTLSFARKDAGVALYRGAWTYDGAKWSADADFLQKTSALTVWSAGALGGMLGGGVGGAGTRYDPDAKGAARCTSLFSGLFGYLTQLSVVGVDDAWAASSLGCLYLEFGPGCVEQGRAMHWTTGGWATMHVPAPRGEVNVARLHAP